MSGLTPQVRPDKNGKLVTRHIRFDPRPAAVRTNIPNRVTAGKSGAGRFDFKQNSEAEIDLVDDGIDNMEFGDGVYGDYPRNYEKLADLESDYMRDVEADPTIEGMEAAVAKYRREAIRFELEVMTGQANRENYPDKDWYEIPSDNGWMSEEMDDDDFYLTPALLEDRALKRVNEVRKQQLESQYGKYRGEFPEGPAEIELSTTTEHGKWSGTIVKERVAGYEESIQMRHSVAMAITSTNAGVAINEVNKAVKEAHDSGTGAAYVLARTGFNAETRKPEYNEVLVVPSKRETERIGLGTKAISEGWL